MATSEIRLKPPSHTHILCHCESCGHIILYPLSLLNISKTTCPDCGRSLIEFTAQANDAPLCSACFHCIPRGLAPNA